jgi:hypothetical protein
MPDNTRIPKDESQEQLLDDIFRKFGRKQEPGEPPLESLPPSQRFVPNSPLNEQESNAIFRAVLPQSSVVRQRKESPSAPRRSNSSAR